MTSPEAWSLAEAFFQGEKLADGFSKVLGVKKSHRGSSALRSKWKKFKISVSNSAVLQQVRYHESADKRDSQYARILHYNLTRMLTLSSTAYVDLSSTSSSSISKF